MLNLCQSWLKKSRSIRFTMLRSMHIDIIGEFENYQTAQEIWN